MKLIWGSNFQASLQRHCPMMHFNMYVARYVDGETVTITHEGVWEYTSVWNHVYCIMCNQHLDTYFSLDLRMYVQKLTSHGFENIHCMMLTLRTRIVWCWLYKAFENASWCQQRERVLCISGCWVCMNLRMHMLHMTRCRVRMNLQMHTHWARMSRCWLVNMCCIHMNVEYARTWYDVDNWEWEWCWLQCCCSSVFRWGHKHVRCE